LGVTIFILILVFFKMILHTHIQKFNNIIKLFCALFTKEALALRISRAMFNERKCIESFNACQCIRSYLVDLSMQELIELAKDYGIEVGKDS